MGTVTIGVDAGASGASQKVYTISNANLGRLVTWSKAHLFGGRDPSTITNVQAMDAWMDFVIQQSKSNVLSYERSTAAVADILVT